ncbi:WbqC family protein [Metabacillus fastidiosus]|uniref:WbqC family protein n=1 Tax=Metabacillus fastidiosus TaxID=1458 RepID=UPI003D29C59C
MKDVMITKPFLTANVQQFLDILKSDEQEFWEKEQLLMEKEGKWEFSVALIDDEDIVVFIIASIDHERRSIHIHKFMTRESSRSQGLGTKLFQKFLDRLSPAPYSNVTLKVRRNNKKAQALYKKLGFYILDHIDEHVLMKRNMGSTVVAIHQPNFFPWIGYFHKIAKADVFVFLDDIPIPQTGRGSYINRVKILMQGQSKWLTCPIIRGKSRQIIKDVRMDNQQAWKEKTIKTLTFNYRKAPYYKETMEWLTPLLMRKTEYLSEYNMENIRFISNLLEIKTNFQLQSGFQSTLSSTELLIDLVNCVGGKTYYSGKGGHNYQEEDRFKEEGINLVYQDFASFTYPQLNTENFISGLSIIDCFFNLGIENSKKMLQMNLDPT